MRRDHKVEYRSRERIRAFATEVRELSGLRNQLSFDICRFVEKKLPKILEHMGKGSLQVILYDKGTLNPGPAHVTFSPLALHIERDVWWNAKLNKQLDRFIVAHEVGHLLLHDHFAKPFSEDPALRIEFEEPGHSAEWQADSFAADFLLPIDIAARFPDEDFLVEECHVYERVVSEKLQEAKSRKYDGEACTECANFTLVRSGTCLKCDTCGSTTGRS